MFSAERRESMIAIVLVVGMIAGMRVTAMMPETVSEFDRVLPETIGAWKKAGPPVLYTRQNLSDYIDGGAELYLSYNFSSSLSVKYAAPDGSEITVDIFDMAASFDAFGVFAHTRETIESDVGQGSEYADGLLAFWKGRYYVSIMGYPETAALKDAVFELGRAVAGAIESEGPLPPIIALLPQENLLAETVRYFHHYIWLNSFTFVSNENVLDIGDDTPAALAKYRQSGSTFFLLLVRYPDEARAEAASGRFRQVVLGGAAEGMRPLQDGRWTGLQRRGGLVCIVLNAPDAATVREILAKIKA